VDEEPQVRYIDVIIRCLVLSCDRKHEARNNSKLE